MAEDMDFLDEVSTSTPTTPIAGKVADSSSSEIFPSTLSVSKPVSKDGVTFENEVAARASEPVSMDAVNGNGDMETTEDGMPVLMGVDYPREYRVLVDRVLSQYRMLPKLDYNALYKEMRDLTVRSSSTPALQDINRELQLVQSAKERLCEILNNISRIYLLKKRALDILAESWSGKYSTEKSADKRSGDAVYRLSDFSLDFGQVEQIQKVALQIGQNLESVQESLSRRISIFQMQLKLHDIGRTALPSTNFEDDILKGVEDEKSGDGLEAKEMSF